MRIAVILPIIASVTCLEIAVIFAVAFFRFQPRRFDFAHLSIYSVMIAWMIAWTLALQEIRDIQYAAFLFRMQFIGIYLGIASLVLLTSRLTQINLPRWLRAIYLYPAFGTISLFAWHPQVIHQPPPNTPVYTFHIYNNLATGDWFGLYAITPILAVIVCSGFLIRSLLQNSRQSKRLDNNDKYRRVQRDLAYILLGTLTIIGSAIVEILELFQIPKGGIDWWVNPRAATTTLFCLIAAWVLGKHILAIEEERRKAEMQAEVRYRVVDELYHDIKQKIAAIIWPLRCVTIEDENFNNRTSIERALENACNMEDAAHAFLSFARACTGRDVSGGTKRIVDIESFIHRISENCMNAERSRNRISSQDKSANRICCTFSVSHAKVLMDTCLVEAVLYNLIDNAMKYSHIDTAIYIKVSQNTTTLEVDIIDNGVGMEIGKLKRVFQLRPFESQERPLDILSSSHSIGLATSKRFVEAMGGSIKASSDGPGKGSTFSVSIPITIPDGR